MANQSLHWADILVVVVYFTVCLLVGLLSSCRTNTGSLKGYFLAGRSMTWLPVGASIFSTNVGSQFFIGMAGTAAATGIGVIIFEWHAIFPLMLLGWFFVPVYAASGTYTMPEYLKKRFGGRRLRVLLSVVAIFIMVVQKISVVIYAGAVFVQQAVGWNLYLSTVSVTVVAAVYTIIGGMSAVIYTDTLQTAVMIVGSFILTGKGLSQVGGMDGLFTKYMKAIPDVTQCHSNVTSGYPPPDSLHIFRSAGDNELPWPGTTIGLTPMAVLAWCTDQVIVQRALSAKSLNHAKGGAVVAGYLKILPFFMIVIPGMISRVLFPNEVGCVDPDICERVCRNRNGCSNIAYPKLVIEILPQGLRGIMLAVMLSALMSTLTSVFNSASSIFTVDLYRRCRKRASQRELMVVSRVFIVGLVAVSIAWIPILNEAQGGRLWDYLQAIQSYLGPPWCVVFVMAIAWPRATEKGAFWALMGGLVAGGIRLALHLAYPTPACGQPENRPPIYYRVHYLYYSIISTVITTILLVVFSLFTKPRSEKQLNRVTWWTRHSSEPQGDVTDDDEDDFDRTIPKISTKVSVIVLPEDGESSAKTESTQKQVVETPSLRQRVHRVLCCYSSLDPSSTDAKAMSEHELRQYRGDNVKPVYQYMLYTSAILLMAVIVFLFVYYG